MKSSNQDDELITDINVTPFVDVVLVLLILFMIAAPAVYQTGLKVDLPKIVNGQKTKHITMTVLASSAGDIYIDQEKVTVEALTKVALKAKSYDPSADIILKADKTINYDKVISILDALRGVGIKNIALGAESK
jgi:biopolymer transport protein ExbD